MAHDLRSNPNLLVVQHKNAEDHLMNIERRTDQTIRFSRHEITVNDETYVVKSSDFFSNNRWVSMVKRIFDPSQKLNNANINKELFERGDELQKVLLTRLGAHVRRRIEDPIKREHWSLKWAARNMAQISAIMVLFNHTKEDCAC